MASLPIAVLDTGAGGLSVVQAIRRLLPSEDIHYFADTAHLPYGIKSPELIRHLTLKMINRVQEISSCKILVIACHTISVWCCDEIEQKTSIPVIGMVKPSLHGLRLLMSNKALSTVGVLSTKATLNSKTYRNAWPFLDPSAKVQLIEQACGPLVSLVEEGEIEDHEQIFILNHLLSDAIKQCDGLLIGCTHFSALVPSLKKVLKTNCHIVDAADFTADAVALALRDSMDYRKQSDAGRLTVHVSDNKERFANSARRFMQEDISINLISDYVTS